MEVVPSASIDGNAVSMIIGDKGFLLTALDATCSGGDVKRHHVASRYAATLSFAGHRHAIAWRCGRNGPRAEENASQSPWNEQAGVCSRRDLLLRGGSRGSNVSEGA